MNYVILGLIAFWMFYNLDFIIFTFKIKKLSYIGFRGKTTVLKNYINCRSLIQKLNSNDQYSRDYINIVNDDCFGILYEKVPFILLNQSFGLGANSETGRAIVSYVPVFHYEVKNTASGVLMTEVFTTRPFVLLIALFALIVVIISQAKIDILFFAVSFTIAFILSIIIAGIFINGTTCQRKRMEDAIKDLI